MNRGWYALLIFSTRVQRALVHFKKEQLPYNTGQTGWYALFLIFNAIWSICENTKSQKNTGQTGWYADQLPENTARLGWYALWYILKIARKVKKSFLQDNFYGF